MEDKLPPYSSEHELTALGYIMMDPNGCGLEVAGACTPELFYDLRHRVLFEKIREISASGRTVDELTLFTESKSSLEGVQNLPAFIAGLTNYAFTSRSWHQVIEELKKLALARAAIRMCAQYDDLFRNNDDAEKTLDSFEAEALALRGSITKTAGEVDVKSALTVLVDKFEKAVENKGTPPGLITNIHELDRLTGGLRPGELVITAARPSVGKSALASNIAEHIAVELALPVGIISLEMKADALLERMTCSMARVNSRLAEEGEITEGDTNRLAVAIGRINKAPLFIYDSPATMAQIAGIARRWKRKKIALLIVDYLQLIKPFDRKKSRYEAITETSASMKELANELNIPVLCLAQLNRASDAEDREPRISDLRDSGGIEQDAYKILLLHRPKGTIMGDAIKIECTLGKNRNGPIGTFNLSFCPTFTRFESANLCP